MGALTQKQTLRVESGGYDAVVGKQAELPGEGRCPRDTPESVHRRRGRQHEAEQLC